MQEFRDKTAVVTGGGTGIGLGISHAMADLGVRVVAAGMQPPERDAGVDFRFLDVTSQPEVEALAATLDRLDFLVNCAGIIRRDAEFEMPAFLEVVDVNLAGTMRMCIPKSVVYVESSEEFVKASSQL